MDYRLLLSITSVFVLFCFLHIPRQAYWGGGVQNIEKCRRVNLIPHDKPHQITAVVTLCRIQSLIWSDNFRNYWIWPCKGAQCHVLFTFNPCRARISSIICSFSEADSHLGISPFRHGLGARMFCSMSWARFKEITLGKIKLYSHFCHWIGIKERGFNLPFLLW